MKALVMFQSRTGNTRKAAELLGGELRSRGLEVAVRPVDGLDYKEVAAADLVCVGTWVDGIILFGHRPGDTGKLRKVPMLWNKPVGAFMTYALHGGRVLDEFTKFLTNDLGAFVIGQVLMKRGSLDADISSYVDSLLEHFSDDQLPTLAQEAS